MFSYAEFILQLRLFKIASDDVCDDGTEEICNDTDAGVALSSSHQYLQFKDTVSNFQYAFLQSNKQ